MNLFVLCVILMLIQFAAAVPWLLAWSWQPAPPPGGPRVAARGVRPTALLGGGLGVAVGAGLVLGLLASGSSPGLLEGLGQGYGSLLQAQLHIDLFVLLFAVLLLVWPKGAAVARAAFREGYRQPMFWLLMGM